MRVLKTLVAIVVALFLIVVGVLLTVNNQQLVAIDLVFVQIPEASLARWLIASFLVGAVLSLIFTSLAVVAMKSRLRRTRKQLDRSSRELDKLRTLNLNTPA